jgi:GT2 family glycosyltransferase
MEYVPKIVDSIGPIRNEILIWDNRSTDGTFDWLSQYGRADCRVTEIFGSDKNIGMEAINRMAKVATGNYILKIDDDMEVPVDFAKRMVGAYEEVGEEKLMFLSWNMPWRDNTFAARSGLALYKEPRGKTVNLKSSERVLINYTPSKWMANGACRLSPRKDFLKMGGHPKGVIYGVDHRVSIRAEERGYWIGYLDGPDLVHHRGGRDSEKYRKLKDRELKKHNCPRHV